MSHTPEKITQKPIINSYLAKVLKKCIKSYDEIEKEEFYCKIQFEDKVDKDQLYSLLRSKKEREQENLGVPHFDLSGKKRLSPLQAQFMLRHYRSFAFDFNMPILDKFVENDLPFYFIKGLHIHQLPSVFSIEEKDDQ